MLCVTIDTVRMAFWRVQTGQNGPLKTFRVAVTDVHNCLFAGYSAWSRYECRAGKGTILRNNECKVDNIVQDEARSSGIKIFYC